MFDSWSTAVAAIDECKLAGGLQLNEDDALQPNAKLALKPHFVDSEKRGEYWIIVGTVDNSPSPWLA
jgi:hypothetical protein